MSVDAHDVNYIKTPFAQSRTSIVNESDKPIHRNALINYQNQTMQTETWYPGVRSFENFESNPQTDLMKQRYEKMVERLCRKP